MSGNPTPSEVEAQIRLAREKIKARMSLMGVNNFGSPRPPPPPSSLHAPTEANNHQQHQQYVMRPASVRPAGLGGISSLDLQRKIREAKELVHSLHKAPNDPRYEPKLSGGLNMQIHPLLAQAAGKTDPEAISESHTQKKLCHGQSKFKVCYQAFEEGRRTRQTKKKKPEDITKKAYFDPELGLEYAVPKPRLSKSFRFAPAGKFIEQGNQLRAEQRVDELRQKIAERAKAAGMEEELELVSDKVLKKEPPPHVEWWDRDFFLKPPLGQEQTYDYKFTQFDEVSGITAYIQHPVPIKPPFEKHRTTVKPLILTKRERKKLRRQRRAETHKEKQEKIRLGLLPPEQPKVKLSNLMRVLGNEAVQDPTQIEAQVRQQVAERKRAHDEQNAERKLTEEERREKKRRKMGDDVRQHGLRAVVFKIKSLNSRQKKFKVEKNASQLQLSGIGVINPNFCLVFVEGGPKSIKAYKKLMLRRIQWDEEDESEQHPEGVEPTPNYCHMVWEGDVPARAFKGFSFRLCPSDLLVRQTLVKNNAEHYWELAKAYKEDYVALDRVLL
ncbi:U4/U5/U6 small nuclear ribonucleoprotein prp3 [Entomophthora muscae]|uniref:U4/U5/U6 small nuclear ribonucleoprotein prp3 n=1 Tax=Entomophthora muscae TaxID=34485 RepID=A0ACC2TYV8_9FUNG|nr:U4/U5/U6 small nuclear ribonucleoprotein prp3 [Entomophthora muscae]